MVRNTTITACRALNTPREKPYFWPSGPKNLVDRARLFSRKLYSSARLVGCNVTRRKKQKTKIKKYYSVVRTRNEWTNWGGGEEI
jgi:hypothetical protein